MTVDLESAAAWAALPHEVQSHVWRLVLVRRQYEALRVLGNVTGDQGAARVLVAWLAQMMIKGEK